MSKLQEWLSGKKTIVMGVLGVVGAIMAWASNEITALQALTLGWGAVTAIFLRVGVKKSGM